MEDQVQQKTSPPLHVLALPYPGRGHINPMVNLCELLLYTRPHDLLVTFVVTEEWLGLLSSSYRPASCCSDRNFRFATIPNVIPSEHHRAKDMSGFFEAIRINLEGPFERLLNTLEEKPEPQPAVIVTDTFLHWVVGVGSRRNIPVASLWTQSASVYSILRHFELFEQNGHLPDNFSDIIGKEQVEVDYIPGIPTTHLVSFAAFITGIGRLVIPKAVECISMASKAQFLLLTSFEELEPHAIEALRPVLSIPIYSVGPTIPFSKLELSLDEEADYIRWLDAQPSSSVLYVSQGSFLSVSNAQLEEIIAGICGSGIRFLWVARENVSLIKDKSGGQGLVVPWCNQLKVLCHKSVGGFWTHCGWNSTLEAIYSGVPMLTCPIVWDQFHNSKQIVEDWKIGFRVRKIPGCEGGDVITTKDEIKELVRKLMDSKSKEGMEARRRAEELRQRCAKAIAGGSGSSDINLDAFIRDIEKSMLCTKICQE